LTNPAAVVQFCCASLWSDRRAPSTLAAGDEVSMNSHEPYEVAVSQPARTMLGCERVRPYASTEGGMDDQGVPEAWIGQEVVIHTVSSREFLATLVEVKDFGFAYRFRDSEDIIFAPWSVLRWMRLAGEEAQYYRT
jgi:hypothetical protein